MKTLYLMRHAKSSWDDLALSDFERPLDARGQRDAPLMGERLAAKSPRPELIYASTAERVRQTIQHVARAIGYPESEIAWRPDIYEGGVEEVLEILRGTDDRVGTVLLAGHNPTISWCVSQWSREFGHHFPTAGIACLRLETEHWSRVTDCEGALVDYDYPKKNDD